MAELWSLTSLYVVIGVVAGLAMAGAVFWAARRCAAVSTEGEEEEAKRRGLLNKDAAVVHAPAPKPADTGGVGDDAELCAICKARLADAEGPCRLLRPCGHVYHAECIDLWLERRTICPLCRAAVLVSRTEIIDAIV